MRSELEYWAMARSRAHIQFEPRAVEDLEKAMAWYEGHVSGLGTRFFEEIEATLERLAEHPTMYAVVTADARRAFLRRFPFSIYNMHTDNVIEVLAILHTSRQPDAWQHRSEQDERER